MHRVLLYVFVGLALGNPTLPDATLTPGDTLNVSMKTLCTPGYTATARNVSESTKKAVFKEYNIKYIPKAYEIDHLISLELGGSNDIKNLWPESYSGQNNAHIKDALEDHLNWLVCNNKVPLTEAQTAISQNWITAYQKYIPMK